MYEQFLIASLASLRLAPTFAFAPPFTLLRIPPMVRGTMAIAFAVALELGATGQSLPSWEGNFAAAAMSELALGLALALALQLAFAMIAMVGRALDIQAGFGLAFLIDPTTKAQMPLIGAVFTYLAAAMFFASNGPFEVLAIFSASFAAVPLGGAIGADALSHILGFLSTLSVLALGVAGLASVVLLLIDLVVAMMSRTLPQMNVLVLGFQVKAIILLVLLPITLGLSASVIATILRLAIEAMFGVF